MNGYRAHSRITYPAIDRTHPAFSGSREMTGPSVLRDIQWGDETSAIGEDNTVEESLRPEKNNERDHLMSWKPGGFFSVSNPSLRSNSLALTERSHDAFRDR